MFFLEESIAIGKLETMGILRFQTEGGGQFETSRQRVWIRFGNIFKHVQTGETNDLQASDLYVIFCDRDLYEPFTELLTGLGVWSKIIFEIGMSS